MAIKDTLPTIRPTLLLDFANTKVLDPRITFARASTATYYDGVTSAKAEENLFYPSVNIGSPYQNAANALTNNVGTAPDGTPTASLLVPTSAAVRHYCSSPLGPAAPAGTAMTGSVHIKAAGYGFAFVMLAGSTGAGGSRYGVTINLSTGAVGGYSASSNVSGQSAAVTIMGGGWFRVALTATSALASAQPVIYVQSMPTDGAAYVNGGDFLPAYSGNGVDGAYFWGFQLERRAFAAAYTSTTTGPVTTYIPALQTAPAGVPRFDHCPISGRSLGLLIEEARTNLLRFSEQFENTSAWIDGLAGGGSSPVRVTNDTIAPDGTLTADKITFRAPAVADQSSITQSVAGLTASVPHTVSFWIKAAAAEDVGKQIAYRTVGSAQYAVVTLTAVYQRATLTSNAAGTDGLSIGLRPLQGSSMGTVSIHIWGGQLEAGAFATSYIPTAASAVTRAADSASMTGANFSSWFRADEGTLFVDGRSDAPTSDGIVRFAAAIYETGSYNNAVRLERMSGTWRDVRTVAGVSNVVDGPWAAGVGGRFAGAYSSSGNAASFNGATPSGIAGGVPSALAVLGIGGGIGGNYLCGTIKRLAYYPRRLTNAQLQSLTA